MKNNLNRTLFLSHRGESDDAPENTLAAFGAAIAMGANEIEMDIRFTSDGVPVVAHDSALERVSNGEGFIEEKTFAELRALDFGSRFGERYAGVKIATFEEVLSKFARHAVINLHLKTAEKEGCSEFPQDKMELIVALLEKYDQQDHVYFMGDYTVMESAIKYAPHIPRCMGAFPNPFEIVDRAIKYNCKKVQFFTPHYTQEMIDKAHAHGIICNFFYSDDPAETKALLEMGIDTVLTNDYFRNAQARDEFVKEKTENSAR